MTRSTTVDAALAAALTVVLFGLLAACSDGAAGGPAGASTPSVPSSAPPTDRSSPSVAANRPSTREDPAVPPPPRSRNDRRGRVELAEYVLAAWVYALRTNDTGPLLRAGAGRPCGGCPELFRELRRRDREGWHVTLGDVRVRSTQVRAQGRRARVSMRVDIPRSETVHDDGSFRSTSPAHPGRRFTVEMEHRKGRFRLVSFAVS